MLFIFNNIELILQNEAIKAWAINKIYFQKL
jgi:hypothetical protein